MAEGMWAEADGQSIYFVFVYTVDPALKHMARQVIGIFQDVLSAKRLERLYNGRARKRMGTEGQSVDTVRDDSGRIIKAVAVRFPFPYVAKELQENQDG